jgi:dipeptidase D
MLNLDSEVEGVFTVSCAGGNVTQCFLHLDRKPYRGEALGITVGGLIGGHSGIEIHKGLGNSNLLMGRVLCAAARKYDLRLDHVEGGQKDNAIPRETRACVVTTDPAGVTALCRELDRQLKAEYALTDPDVFVSVEPVKGESIPMDAETTRRVICFLTCAPNGVQVMSAGIPGLVQTSLNLGILRAGDNALVAAFCVRSSVETQKQMLVDRLTALTESLGGQVKVEGDYAGWAYRQDSPLRELLTEVFTEQYGHAPEIEAIHAGVECGIFAGKLPGLDCVSLGPDLTEIHTCRERMHIASVQRLWALVLEVLKRMK